MKLQLEDLFSRRVILVTGKGGVGRSTISASLALAGARKGKRVLLAEIYEHSDRVNPDLAKSHLAAHFDLTSFPFKPLRLHPGRGTGELHGVSLNSELGTELFLAAVIKVPGLAKLAMKSKAFIRLLRAGPSLHEMGVFYHLYTLLTAKGPDGNLQYDYMIVDMPATGHTLALTTLPDILLRLVTRGPIANALRDGQSILNDSSKCLACIVTLPEPLPLTEASELSEGLKESKMALAGYVVNRVPADPFTREERAELAKTGADVPFLGLESIERIDSAREALAKFERESEATVFKVPEFHDVPGAAIVREVANLFAEGGAT